MEQKVWLRKSTALPSHFMGVDIHTSQNDLEHLNLLQLALL